jgi:hypothetical protein
MEIAFDGSPFRREIKKSLDWAFAATSTPISDDNYSRAGLVLVSFKNKYGIREWTSLIAFLTGRETPASQNTTFRTSQGFAPPTLCKVTTP